MSEKEFVPDFILLGTMDLQKSVASGKAVKDGTAEKRFIYGEISNENVDEEEERLIQKSLDFSYYDDNGWIKYEHVANDPKHIIGCPHSRITENNRTIIKGAILKNKTFADDVWELILSIEQHNRENPKHQKSLGWSIEGSYTDNKKSKGGDRIAKVINVVITPNPVNKTVYLKRVEDSHRMIAKAMSATPTSTDVTKKTGGDVITKDNIDQNLKSTAEEIKAEKDKKKKLKNKKTKETNKSKELQMFKSFEEAKQHYLDLKVEDAEAERLAKALFPEDSGKDKDDETAETVEETNSLVKGLKVKFEEFMKNVKLTKSADADADDDDPVTDTDPEFIDVAESLQTIQKSLDYIKEFQKQKAEYDYGTDQSFGKAIGKVETVQTSLETITSGLTVKIGDKKYPLAKAVEFLIKSRSGNVSANLSDLEIATDKKEGVEGAIKMNWAEMTTTLDKGIDAKRIDMNERGLAENAFRMGEVNVFNRIITKCDPDKK